MKVLDPQAGLLTTSELYQFLKSGKPRPVDKKIGAYKSVNLHNNVTVRQDLETYVQASAPHVLKQAPSETWMKELVVKLKEFELTKTEVLSLINLGVGMGQKSQPTPVENDETHEGVNGNGEQETNGEQEEDEENSLDRMLFGLVVEESDERFSGDEGEERITEILSILKDTIGVADEEANGKAVNGRL